MVLAQLGVLQFDNVRVLNPVVEGDGTMRQQLIFDSATGLLVNGDGVRGFIGFSIFPAEGALPLRAGIGPACNGDLGCGTASGHPSWHIATSALHADS